MIYVELDYMKNWQVCPRNILPALWYWRMIRYLKGPLPLMMVENQRHNTPEPVFIHPVANAKRCQDSLRENKTGSNKAQYKWSTLGFQYPSFSGESYCGLHSPQGRPCSKRKEDWKYDRLSTTWVHVMVENSSVFCRDFGSYVLVQHWRILWR